MAASFPPCSGSSVLLLMEARPVARQRKRLVKYAVRYSRGVARLFPFGQNVGVAAVADLLDAGVDRGVGAASTSTLMARRGRLKTKAGPATQW